MPATAFDTLQATETLTAAGVQDVHARAIVLMMRDAVTEGVASKADVSDAKANIRTEIADVKAELKTEIADVKAELKTGIARIVARIEAAVNRVVLAFVAVGGLVVAAAGLILAVG